MIVVIRAHKTGLVGLHRSPHAGKWEKDGDNGRNHAVDLSANEGIVCDNGKDD